MAFDFVLLNASQPFLTPPILDLRALEKFLRICFQEPAPGKGVTHWSFDTASAAGWVK
jgi:hypothetical protein